MHLLEELFKAFDTNELQTGCASEFRNMRQQCHPMLHRALLLLAVCCIVPSVRAQASWQSMAPTTGRLGGDFLITVVGTNFATTAGNTYRCQFEMSARGFVVNSAPVSASSATRVVCSAPAFPEPGSTVMKVITQTGSTVIKSGAATAVFIFAVPVVNISGPSTFVMADCGALQALTLTITMFHPTSTLGINSTLLRDRETGAVVTSGRLAASNASRSYSVNFLWTPASLSSDRVARFLNFSVVVSEVDFASPDRVEVWREIEVLSPPEFVDPSPVQNSNLSVAVGQTLRLTLAVADRNPQGSLDIALVDGSGLPNSATLTAVEPISSSLPYAASIRRVLSFAPLPSFAGLVFVVCLRASSDAPPFNGCPLCFTVSIPAPAPEVVAQLSSPASAISSAVNCNIRLTLAVVDRGSPFYCAVVTVTAASSTQPAVLPPFSSFVQTAGPTSAANPSTSCTNGSSFEFSWQPVRGQDGMTFAFCFSIASALLPKRAVATVCHSIAVAKCRVCAGPGDTIGSIAARYSTDWLQLWGSNFNISEPDSLQQGQLMALGPMYRTRFGDTLASVAQLFGTTASSILALNPDVPVQEALAAGMLLCVQPLVS